MLGNVILIILIVLITYIYKTVTSSENSKIKFKLYYLGFYVYGMVITSLIWPFFLLRPRNAKNGKHAANILKQITKLYGVTWELRNSEVLSEDRGGVIVANHQSSMDILGLFNVWSTVGNLAPVAKKELMYLGPIALAGYLAGTVFVDRKNPKGAYKQLQNCTDAINVDRSKLWLFPEGTRNKDRTKLLPFKKGAFVMAITAQAPILPVVYSPYYFINQEKYIFDKGHMIISCLDAIPTTGLTLDDLPALIDRVYKQMNEEYQRLSNEVQNKYVNTQTSKDVRE